jgi:hypothetical protein
MVLKYDLFLHDFLYFFLLINKSPIGTSFFMTRVLLVYGAHFAWVTSRCHPFDIKLRVKKVQGHI